MDAKAARLLELAKQITDKETDLMFLRQEFEDLVHDRAKPEPRLVKDGSHLPPTSIATNDCILRDIDERGRPDLPKLAAEIYGVDSPENRNRVSNRIVTLTKTGVLVRTETGWRRATEAPPASPPVRPGQCGTCREPTSAHAETCPKYQCQECKALVNAGAQHWPNCPRRKATTG